MKKVLWFLLISVLLSDPGLLYAKSPEKDMDLFAPTIIHDVPKEIISRGEKIEIRAIVTDDAEVATVTLYYRAEGELSFKSVEMTKSQGDEYKATIPSSATRDASVEYYIESSDKVNNFALRGFSATPLVILLSDVPFSPDAEEPESTELSVESEGAGEKVDMTENLDLASDTTDKETKAAGISSEKPWYKKWWVWAIGGAVLVAAAAGGGGGGGSSAGAGTPPGGTLIISGPSP